MASELNPTENIKVKTGESRRSFLAKLGLGAAALGLVAGSLSSLRGLGSNFHRDGSNASAKNIEFPGEDSIFHPAVDPREDPRRTKHG